VILLVAYMNYFGLKQSQYTYHYMANQYVEDMTPARLLLGFLDFYGNQFNPATTGISVVDEG
jgi:hypothetical protein